MSQSSAFAKRSSNRTVAQAWTSSTSPTRKRARSRSWIAISRKEPAGGQQELERRRMDIAGIGAELLDPPELARIDELLRSRVPRVEAAHEADLDRDARLAPQLDDARRVGDLLGDRLLRPDRLARPQRGIDERRMRRGGRDDDDRVDRRVVDGLERVGHGALGAPELPAADPRRPRPGRPRRRRSRSGSSRCCAGGSRPMRPAPEHGDPDVVGIAQREAAHRACHVAPGRALDASPSSRREHRHSAAFGAVGLQSMSHCVVRVDREVPRAVGPRHDVQVPAVIAGGRADGVVALGHEHEIPIHRRHRLIDPTIGRVDACEREALGLREPVVVQLLELAPPWAGPRCRACAAGSSTSSRPACRPRRR